MSALYNFFRHGVIVIAFTYFDNLDRSTEKIQWGAIGDVRRKPKMAKKMSMDANYLHIESKVHNQNVDCIGQQKDQDVPLFLHFRFFPTANFS